MKQYANKILSLILAAVLVFTLVQIPAQAAEETGEPDTSWYGDGSATGYTISTADELAGLAVLVNNGDSFYGKIITLADNIDLSGYDAWTPIGDMGFHSFKGVFDGDGHTIYGLTVDADSEYAGLFGLVDYDTAVENLTVSGNVTGKTLHSRIGGIAGENRGEMQNCGFIGTVTDATIDGTAIGGLLGYNLGTVSNCYNGANVANGIYAGGIVGISDYGIVQNSYNTGSVSGRNGGYAGGLVGYNRAAVMNSYSTDSVTGGTYNGGVCGMNDGGSVWYVYWNKDEFGDDGFGDSANNAYSYEVIGISTSEMKADDFVETLTNNGISYNLPAWESDTAGKNGGYPVLCSEAGDVSVPKIKTRILPDGVAGVPYSYTLIAKGDQPITWSIDSGSLPDGLSLDANTGVISGTPTTDWQTCWPIIKVENSLGSDTRSFTIWISPAPPSPPEIQTSSLPSGWLGDYYLQYLEASGEWPTWSIIGGSLPDGLYFYEYSGTIEGYPTESGTFNFTVQAENYLGSDSKDLSISVIAPDGNPPVIPTNILPDGTVGVPYSHTLEVESDTPVTWYILPGTGALPSGLSLNQTTGVISGTPTTSWEDEGLAGFMLRAVNAGDKVEMYYNLQIFVPASVAPTITTNAQQSRTVGVYFSLQCEATGSEPISWDITGDIPYGCSMTSAAGIVSGTPAIRGTWTFTVTATNDAGSDTKQITITAVGGSDNDYGLIFDSEDGIFYLDYGDKSEVYTGQSDKWAWDTQTKTLSLNGFAWETPANCALNILSGDYNTFTISLSGTNVFASSFTGISVGGYLGGLEIKGNGSLYINAGSTSSQFGTGIESGGAVTVSGGNIAISSTGYEIDYGILTNGDFAVTGGKVDITASGGSIESIGVVCFYCGSVLTSDGELNIESDGYGIFSDGEYAVIFIDGKMMVEGGIKALEGSYGDAAYVSAADYVYWANTSASDPGGDGTRYPGTAYTHNDEYKYIKFNTLYTPVKGTHYTVSALNAEGWTNTDFVITAKAGFMLSTDYTAAGSWSSVVTYGTETSNGREVFYVRDATTGEISAAAEEAYKIDKTAPNSAVQYKTNDFQSFLKTTAIERFFKKNMTVTIQGADVLSGVSMVEYYKASGEVTNPETGITGWTTGTSFNVTQNEKFILYIRVTDKAGNKAIFYEGVAAYTDSTADTETISYTKTATGDVTAKINLNGNTIDKISNDTQDLTKNTHYTVSNGEISFKAAYLDTLAAGSYTMTVHYKPLGEAYVTGAINEPPNTTTISLTVSKANRSAPSAPVEASKTKTSITLQTIAGAEYSIDGSTWQDSETFTELSPNTGYTFFARLKETADFNASPASDPSAMITTEKEPLSGTVSFFVNQTTGEVTASASGGNTGYSGALTYTWSGGASGTGAAITPTIGSAATCTVTASGAADSIFAAVTVYMVEVALSDNETGDSAEITSPYGKAGDTVSITYTVGNTGNATNSVEFTGGTVNDSGTDTAAYEIDANDATSGIIAITATFTHSSLPLIDGTLNLLAVDAASGKLTATVSDGSGAYTCTWSVDGQVATLNGTANGGEYTPHTSELGKEITCTVTKSGRYGELKTKTTVIKVEITKTGNTGSDNAAIASSYGKAGDSVLIAYTLGNTGTQSNTLTYSGVANPPEQITAPGSNTSSYTISAADASNGVITITAAFAHTNIPLPPIPPATRISASEITGVTSPAAGATPSIGINSGIGFTASLSWNGNPATFGYNTAYTATITLTAAAGYTFNGDFSDSLSISGFMVNGNAPVWVSNNGSMLVFTVTFPTTGSKTDITPPTGSITVKNKAFTSFLNTITFGLFFKNTQTVTIAAIDDSNGAVTVEYFVADSEKTSVELQSVLWVTYSNSFNIVSGKNVIYAKLTDPSKNSAIINTDGIVIYTDSTQRTASISFIKGSSSDVTASVTLNDNTISKIMNGSDTLIATMHYTVSGGTITFKASYLDRLAAGSYTLTIYYNPQGVECPDSSLSGSEAPAATTIALTVNTVLTYAVIVSSVGTGAAGSGNYTAGAVVSINAGTAPSGQRFKEWTASPAVTFANANKDSTSFTMPASAVTVTAVFETIPPTPVYGISLDKSGTRVFGDATEGYGVQPELTVQISNTGNQATGALTISVSDTESFDSSTTHITDIPIGESTTFTLSPNIGLAIGTYTADITVIGSNDITAGFSVSFKVNPAALTGTATISNTSPRVDDMLTGSLVGGNNTGTLTYTWKSDGSQVQTSTEETYVVKLADLGKTITLEITSSVQTGTVISTATAAVLRPETKGMPVLALIDDPIEMQSVDNILNIRGWALYSPDGVHDGTGNIEISIDGFMSVAERYLRADVKDTVEGYGDYSRCGYETNFDIGNLRPGIYQLTVKVKSKDNSQDLAILTRNVVKELESPLPFIFCIDFPTYLQPVQGTFLVSGWALQTDDGTTNNIGKVEIRIGTINEQADLFIREDVAVAFPEYLAYDNSGFSKIMDISSLASGVHNVTIVIYSRDNTVLHTHETAIIKQSTHEQPFISCLDFPTGREAVEKTMHVSGWALHTVNGISNNIGRVEIQVGDIITDANLFVREDVRNAIPGYGDYANSGFAENLDISSLEYGALTVTIRVYGKNNELLGKMERTVDYPGGKQFISCFDRPTETEAVDKIMHVSGWALHTKNGITNNIGRVEVQVGDIITDAGLFVREDVKNAIPGYGDYTNSGFAVNVDISSLDYGVLTVTIRIYGRDNELLGSMERTVEYPNGKQFLSCLDYPTGRDTVDGIMHVSGWALHTKNGITNDIGRVEIQVGDIITDGNLFVREDVRNAIPGYGDYAKSGFAKNVDISSLDYGVLTVIIRIYDNDNELLGSMERTVDYMK